MESRSVLYCIVSVHLYSASCSAHQSEAFPVRETQREQNSFESGLRPLASYINQSYYHSINKSTLYSAPSRSLLRGAPDPGQAKRSLRKLVKLRTGTIWEVP